MCGQFATRKPLFGFIILLYLVLSGGYFYGMDTITLPSQTTLDLELDFRAYALNDQRIYWSGVEFSFGAEAALGARLRKQNKWSSLSVEAEFFLNQPFGKNILTDEFRDDYLANFAVEPVVMSKMNLRFDIGKFRVTIGKAMTPFGRICFQSQANDLNFGAPFIRAEAILWRETGIFLYWRNRFLEVDIAATNGGKNRDTNSGKAGVFRVGFRGGNWRIGASHKIHDGTGSEWQKQYNEHTDLDFMVRFGKLRLFGEWIWDRYGFHRPFDADEIFWPRSLYYRDIYFAYKTPLKGKGWYGGINYQPKDWLIDMNYGQYHPQQIGNNLHDCLNRRGVVQVTYRFVPEARFYFTAILENQREKEPWSAGAKPFAVLAGCEFTL
ncbi:MAG TPA: hypothetical protein ENN40_05035 [Candidatus Aminicenantes bacterium]|nr:hypothetical protein [Candidatus Aminicenantes bacterium]